MRLLWVTPVTFGKTIHQWGEIGTASALKRRGWEIDFLSPENPGGARETLDKFGFGHIPVKSLKLPGMFNLTFNRNLSKILCNESILSEYDVILSEWQASLGVLRAKKILELRESYFPPWLFEDRSPPAHRTILSYFQWIQYRKAWINAANSSDAIEVLVPGLEKFVREKFQISKPMVHCPSGVDLDKFRISPNPSPNVPIRLVYHGSLTRGRGLSRIIELGNEMDNSEIDFKITVFGVGPLSRLFEKYSKKKDWLDFLTTALDLRWLSQLLQWARVLLKDISLIPGIGTGLTFHAQWIQQN